MKQVRKYIGPGFDSRHFHMPIIICEIHSIEYSVKAGKKSGGDRFRQYMIKICRVPACQLNDKTIKIIEPQLKVAA